MKTKKYLLNKFTITDAERLVNSINSLQKLLNGSREPKNIDQKFFIDIVNNNLHSDVIISHTSKSFEYALSYLRWLKNNKLDLNDYIKRNKLLKDALNKSYKRTNSNKFIRKPPFIKKTSSFQRIISEPSIPKKNKEKKVVKKNNHPKSTYRCASCNSFIELGRIKSEPTTPFCASCAAEDPNNKKDRYIRDTFGSRADYKRDRGSWRR